MNRMKKMTLVALLLTAVMLLSGCSLLPEEETVKSSPVIRQFTRPVFKTAQVTRGDMIQTLKVSCKYVPVQTVSLGFALGGEYIDRFFVEVGDQVQQGQLLGQLRLDDLEEALENTQSRIAETELRKAYAERQYEIDRQRTLIQARGKSEEARKEALEALEEQHAKQVQSYDDAIRLLQVTYTAQQKKLEERQIRAPISGTVTSVSKFREGDLSVFGNNVISIIDSTLSLFRATTDHWDSFVPGSEVVITASKVQYTAVVTDEEALGLPAQQKEIGKKANVYFVLKETDFELKDGASGTIEMIEAEYRDVLYLPTKAISAKNGVPIVYFQTEDGIKTYREIETGVTIGQNTQVTGGLEEGESVIVQ